MIRTEALTNLTTSQFRIWAGQQLDPDLPLYNMALSFHIQGSLQPDRFIAAFQAVVDRSDALRTIITEENGIPQQVVLPKVANSISFKDLSGQTTPMDDAASWLKARTKRRFDLGKQLFDSILLKIDEDEYIWYLNQHHLITDGWSCAILYRRVAEFYQLASNGGHESVPKFPPFLNYQLYEKEFKQTNAFAAAATYWKEKHATPADPIELYGHTPSPTATRSKRISYDIGHRRSAALRDLAVDDSFRSFSIDLSLFNLFAALLGALIFRISGNTRMVIGSPSHHRPKAIFKETVGLFIELFPLSVSIPPQATFRDLFESVAPESLDFLKHSLPGAGGIQSGNNTSVVLNFIHAAFSDFCGWPMRSTWIHPDHVDRGHVIRLQVEDLDRSGSIQLHFDLDSDIFDESLARKMIGHFLSLLNALLENPDQVIAAVDLLSDEKKAALVCFNETHADRPKNPNVVELVKQQVNATPQAVAVQEHERSLTYLEIDDLSDRLACRLLAAGIDRGTMVAVFMERSSDLLVAVLGILKTGAVFVPIDAAFPNQRIADVLQDCQAPVVVTQNKLKEIIPDCEAAIVCVDDDEQEPADGSADLSRHQPGESDLAYVIYTSGSTGHPKGVMIPHGALANYLLWARIQYMHDGPHTMPLFSTIGADLTLTTFFLPLVSGGTIRVYPDSLEIVDLSIVNVFTEDAVDIVKLTPSHLAMLDSRQFRPHHIKKLIVGGEDFKAGLAQRIYGMFDGNIEIFNEYGPTEATIGCMIHRFDPAKDIGQSVAIGHPIDNTRIYLLDAGLNPVPRGVTGDIYIAGKGLAKGYLNQASLTSSAFIPDPFNPGEKMYKSGDLGRWQSERSLVFLGRRDHQVKVRGFRIELGEIESALLQLPQIREAVVQVIDRQSSASPHSVRHCRRCGLSSNHPQSKLDDQSICRICRNFETLEDVAHMYFKSDEDLQRIIDRAKATRKGPYDGLMQYSGGKDSTYALYQLVKRGMHPLVFSFDNGFISDGAKENIRRVVEDLKLDLVWGRTPAMNAIFVDSLKRFSNVCNGCQKVINTLSINLALEKGIRYIFTGLSRGQFFETRVAELFINQVFDSATIDRNIIEARKAYHRMDDAVSAHLDVSAFADDTVFEKIQFVDFYRYTDVDLHDMLEFLDQHAPWIRPADTGRSTNCLINEAGIYIHKKERGFHNYELPYSWEVRLGHKERNSALEELNDHIDVYRVNWLLKTVGYDPEEKTFAFADRRIVAYYVPQDDNPVDDLRTRLSQKLPAYMIPAQFIQMDAFPINATGKIDRHTLPPPDMDRTGLPNAYTAPQNPTQQLLADIWAKVMGVEQVGIHDNFFDLGGDSILSIQIVAQAVRHGLELTPDMLFRHATIAELAVHADAGDGTDRPIDKKTSASDFPLANLDPEQLAKISKQLD